MVERAETVPPPLDATAAGAAPTPEDAAPGAPTDPQDVVAEPVEHGVHTDLAPALGRGSATPPPPRSGGPRFSIV